jgi:glycosyltransferase involved in cell wall biosynthesis
MPEIVTDGENGLLIDPESPVALAGALDRFFASCDREAMEHAAAATAGRYSWSEFASRFVRALTSLRGPA